MEQQRNWFVGVDWASETHHVCVLDAHGDKLGERGFTHGGAGLAEMAAWILGLTKTAAEAVHVAIEVPHGPVVESLIERGFAVHAINPKQLDRCCAKSRRRSQLWPTRWWHSPEDRRCCWCSRTPIGATRRR